MSVTLNPYISFIDTARPAMEFYQQVFGGELTISTFAEFGAADAPGADLVMHSLLQTSSGFTLMAADTPEGMQHTFGDNISVSLSGDNADELKQYWSKLSEGGAVAVPLEKQVWGDEFGMCTDKFGIGWMVNIAQTAQ
ncbi:MAG: VOC family protein [Mycobacteriaceae bacterium]